MTGVTAPPALAFTVIGEPVAQGSHRATRNMKIYDEKPNLGGWRANIAHVAHHARQHAEHPGFPTGPVRVHLEFHIRRPPSLPKRVQYPAKRPDLDKYIRAVLDALTAAAVYRDDGQVQSIRAAKYYALDGRPHGVRVVVESLDGDPAEL